MLFATGIKGFQGGFYHAWFLVCIFDPVFFSTEKYIFSPSLLIDLIYLPTSSSPDTSKIPLASITVDGGEYCSSIAVYWSLDFVTLPHIPYNWVYHFFCMYQPLLDIIVVMINIVWTDGVLWLNWSRQGWREKTRKPINNGSPSGNTNPPL